MDRILLPLTIVLYLLGIGLSLYGTFGRGSGARRASFAVLAVGAMVHGIVIVHIGIVRGRVPLNSSAEFLLVFGWLLICLYLVIWWRWRIHAAGLVLPPISLLMLWGAAGVFPGASQPLPYGSEGWFIFHTVASTLGLALLGVAFGMSLIYLLQDHALKSKSSMRVLERLPSLEVADRVGHQAMLVGFPLLTLGIVGGVATNLVLNHRLLMGGVKQILPIVAWLVFGLLVWARVFRGYRGKRSAYLVILGFSLALLSVFGMVR